MQEAGEVMIQDVEVLVGEQIGVGEGAIHTDATVEEARALAELLPKYLVPVTKDAPGSCFDGRDCVYCLDGQNTEPRPSVAGGPLITAYAMAVETGWFGESPPQQLEQRLHLLADVLEAGEIRLGAHVDQVAVASQFINAETGGAKTGCGADDKAQRAAELAAAIASQATAGDKTANTLFQGFMDESYDAEKLSGSIGPEEAVEAFRDWNPRAPLDIVTNADAHDVEVLQADETPTHGHGEMMAVAVKVPGMTIDQKALFRDTGKQIFPIDVPYIDRIAKAMSTGPRAEEQYEILRHSGVAFQAGVYVALCDGSQWFASLKAA
jgi:hypothetical protein